MKITRRDFTKQVGSTVLIFVAAGSSLFMTGCNVFSDILTWIPIGIAALQSIITVLAPIDPLLPAQTTQLLTLIKAAFADLEATVTEYNNDTNPADKATLVAKIRTILDDIVANFQNFLSLLNVANNPIVAVVIGLTNVILAAIAGFLGQLPGALPKPISIKRADGTMLTVVPKYYKKVSDFKKDFNAVCEANHHPELDLR